MLLINDFLIDEKITTTHFICNLQACKGACCIEGDGGAPLLEHEADQLERDYHKIEPFLTEEGKEVIEEQGSYIPSDTREYADYATPLIEQKACAYITYNELGISKCGIQEAHEAGVIDWIKPQSCHLYPIRIERKGVFKQLQYDQWKICAPACQLGQKEKLPLYQFLKAPLITHFGADFYQQLDAYVKQKNANSK